MDEAPQFFSAGSAVFKVGLLIMANYVSLWCYSASSPCSIVEIIFQALKLFQDSVLKPYPQMHSFLTTLMVIAVER